MYKVLFLLLSFILSGAVSAKTTDAPSESKLTAQDLANFSAEDRQLIEASFPELVQDATKGSPVVATIGAIGNCDFDSSVRSTPIQDAIDSSNNYTELRVVEGTYDEENITLDDRSIVIKGGYGSCAYAANDILLDPDSLATIIDSSTGTDPVFRIKGDTTRNTVSMHNLTIKNSGASNWYGGAIRVNSADASVSLNKMALINNIALNGGAIGVTGSNGEPVVTLNSVQVNNNSANEGGGIYCVHPSARVVQNSSDGETHGIYDNNATAGDGGGVLVENGCKFVSYQGSQDIALFGSEQRGIVRNKATGNGGGIAIRNGGKANLYGRNTCIPFLGNYLCLFGNNTEPVSLALNVADLDGDNDGHGGGVYVSGAGSELLAENAFFLLNQAYNGAGVAVEDSATALIKAAFENEAGAIGCWQEGACLDFNGNLANTFGGAFFTFSGAELNVVNGQIRNNRADSAVVGYVNGDSSKLNLEGGVVFGNGSGGSGNLNDNFVFRAYSLADLTLNFVTIADNEQQGVVLSNSDSNLQVGSSIIHDISASAPNVLLESGSNATSNFDCVIAHESNSITGFGISVTDPEFVSRGSDYHLLGTSPAIDYCDDLITQANYKDIDGDVRGFDDATVSGSKTYDIGADESYANDLIFKDGFE